MKKLLNVHIKTFLSVAVILIAVFFVPTETHAATLSISPASDTVLAGKNFSVRVEVGTGGQSINAVSGSVSFSNSFLTLNSISKGSLVTLWAQDPTYSNASGTASFQGVILNGYNGDAGTVVTMNFTAKSQGTASISISNSSSSVLLNDGAGTNVLTSTNGSSITITQAVTPSPASSMPIQPIAQPAVSSGISPVSSGTVPIKGSKLLFTDYQAPLLPSNFVVVKGTASPNSIVTITFTQVSDTGATIVSQTPLLTDQYGDFTFVSNQKVTEGSTYTLVASTEGGQSTSPLTVAVKNSLWFNVSAWIAGIVAIKVSIVLVLLLLIACIYLLYRNHLLKKRL
jgi:hypothetical protein